MDLGMINTALSGIAKLINEARDKVNFFATKSLADVTKLTRVEPLTIISKDLINLEYMTDVNQSLLSLFSAYYLQAVAILTTINNVEVVKVLDSLNPDRDATGFLLGERLSEESVKHLCLESYEYALPGTANVALEFDKDTGEAINSISNLSVGKLLNVQIMPKGETDKEIKPVRVPVSVRLMASVIPNATIVHLLASKNEDISLIERFHAWRSGRITFIKDLILCQDLIDEHKKALIGDDSGLVQEIYRRVTNSKKYGLLTKNPSLVSASNLFVISEQVARDIETKLGGKLTNARIRDKAFDNTYAMIIVVVDREWERVTFYTRGIAASTDLSVKEIKNASKGKGADIGDLLKSLSMGSPVSF